MNKKELLRKIGLSILFSLAEFILCCIFSSFGFSYNFFGLFWLLPIFLLINLILSYQFFFLGVIIKKNILS